MGTHTTPHPPPGPALQMAMNKAVIREAGWCRLNR